MTDRFVPLTVTDVARTTRDAVVVTLDAPFDFAPGQYLTFRKELGGEELRRSYSICSAPGEPVRVGIKRVEDGAFSTWANTKLTPGDVLEAMPPMGRFHAAQPEGAHLLFFAAGSGITPVLSILRHELARGATATLIYANRTPASIMFRSEIEDLKNLHMGRLSVIHVLGQDAQGIELFTGRLDEAKLARLFETWVDVQGADAAFICGPEALMKTVAASLEAHGMPRDAIRYELFASGRPARAPRAPKAPQGRTAQVTLDGETRQIALPEGLSLLEAARAADMDAPFACKAGVCSTCKARVTQGEVEMLRNHALEEYEMRRGYVLTCQSHPLTDRVVFDYDE